MDNNFNIVNKQVDGVYKNLLDNFHPQAREVVNSAKAYLKALHGSSAACSLYVESLARLTNSIKKQNQNYEKGEGGGGTMELEELTNVLGELHSQQLGYLKAFYVDFIVPIEHNLDRDPKVVQSAWKKYVTTSKNRLDSYSKAASTVKRIKKRNKSPGTIYATGNLLDREIKGLSNYQEELTKIQSFFDISLKEAVEMEKRRYGFVRDRQYHLLKEQVSLFKRGLQLGEQLIIIEEPAEENEHKTVEETKLNNNQENNAKRTGPPEGKKPEERKYQHNQQTLLQIEEHHHTARAVYEYNNNNNNKISSDDEDDGFYSSQFLSFDEGDIIRLIGEKSKGGWQYGENIRRHKYGWFPQAYVQLLEEKERPPPPPAPPLPPISTPPPTPNTTHNANNTNHSSSTNDLYATLTRNTNNKRSVGSSRGKKNSIDLPEVDYNEDEEDDDVYSVYSIQNNFDDDNRIRHSRLLFNQFNRFVDKHQQTHQLSRSLSFVQTSDTSSSTNNSNINNINNNQLNSKSIENNLYHRQTQFEERNKILAALAEDKPPPQPQLLRRLLRRTMSFVSVLNKSRSTILPADESEDDNGSILWGSVSMRSENTAKAPPSAANSEDSVFFDDNKTWIKNSVRSRVNHGPWYDLWGQDSSVETKRII